MITYLSLYLFPFILGLYHQNYRYRFVHDFIGFLFGTIIIIMIGFRWELGPDWYSYVAMYERSINGNVFDLHHINRDVGFALLNLISSSFFGSNIKFGVVFVNLVSACLFYFSLVNFCRKQKIPWLAMSIAIPYLVIVISIGYVRQGVAIGFFMLSLTSLKDKKYTWYFLFILLGAAFHKSVLVFFPIFLVTLNGKHNIIYILSIIPCLLGIYYSMANDELLVSSYIESQRQSAGSFVRILMMIIPALLFLIFRNKIRADNLEKRIYFYLSLATFIVPFILLFSSTLADRISLYFIPVQMYVYVLLSNLFSDRVRYGYCLLIYAFYGVSLITWFSLTKYSGFWVPYKSVISMYYS